MLCLGLAIWVTARQERYDKETTFTVTSGRVYTDTVEITNLPHYGNQMRGRFILDSTTYNQTNWGNADTVTLVAKLVAHDNVRTTIDSALKVIALSGQATCTLNIDERNDTLLIGDYLEVIIRFADTLDAGVVTGPATFRYSYDIIHNYQD